MGLEQQLRLCSNTNRWQRILLPRSLHIITLLHGRALIRSTAVALSCFLSCTQTIDDLTIPIAAAWLLGICESF